MADKTSRIKISKISAAHRQLRTAIALWFTDGDPVSIHTLAFAAYEIFHTISKQRDPYRRDLLWDSDWIKDEYKRDWEHLVKKDGTFFKHADRDPNGVLDFNPEINEWYIMFAITGRELCGESQSQEESCFNWWFFITKPKYLTDNGRKMLTDRVPPDVIEYARSRTKREFFELLHDARLLTQGRSPVTGRRFFLPG